MRPFQEYAACPKCNGDDISFSFHKGVAGSPDCPTRDHLHRDCQRCDYTWLSETRDAET